ncbi:MAG: hypothetical protein ACKV19_13965 [Verrucomicrobiales bacterium]
MPKPSARAVAAMSFWKHSAEKPACPRLRQMGPRKTTFRTAELGLKPGKNLPRPEPQGKSSRLQNGIIMVISKIHDYFYFLLIAATLHGN